MTSSISVIIPTLNGGPGLLRLIHTVQSQSMPPSEILIVDSESTDGSVPAARALGCKVTSIRRADFDHARTRNLIAAKATGDTLVFFTQDVAPVSGAFLETLTQPVRSGIAAAAYARQIPAEDATLLEAFARSFNYPSEPSLRHISRVSRRTLKTFFFSNAASAVSRSCFESVGGFPEPAVTNEDMLLCARLLDAGHQIAYVAEAQVVHSHTFPLPELFKRYYRMGSVMREYQPLLRCDRGGGDGMNLIRNQIRHLVRLKRYDLVSRAVAEAALKAIAYNCGWMLRQSRPATAISSSLQSASGD